MILDMEGHFVSDTVAPGDAFAVVQDHNFDRKHPSHSRVTPRNLSVLHRKTPSLSGVHKEILFLLHKASLPMKQVV